MKDPKVDYTLVGGFVLAMLVALVVFLAVLTGQGWRTDTYYTYYDGVTGVIPGTQLLYEGYRIGQVETIERSPDPDTKRFRVTLQVTEGWKIPVDSVAAITEPGLLSAITIDVHAGQADAYLEPGDVIQGRDLQSVFTAVGTLAEQVEVMIRDDLQPIMDSLGQATPRILADVEAITSDLSRVTGEMSVLLDATNRTRIDATIRNMSVTANRLEDMTQDVESAMGEVGDMVRGVGGLVDEHREALAESIQDLRFTLDSVARHVETINANLEATSHNMNEFSRQIRRDPSVLVRGTEAAPEGEAP